jgi:hypothetical protein
MPHLKLLSATLAASVAIAVPAAAEPRDRDDNEAYSERHGKTWKKRSAKHEKQRRYRYAQQRRYRYSYPWTDWWGPFAGPPGL